MKRILMAIAFTLLISSNAHATIFQWSGNGHYYELVPTKPYELTWFQARDNAHALKYLGIEGHLATITSEGENSFLNSTFNTHSESQFSWIGGYEPNDDGVWRWAVGPEAGIQFSLGKNSTAPFNYANWGGVEPNDRMPDEDYAMFNIGTTFASIDPGQWADAVYVPNGNDPVHSYLVEYSGLNVVPEPASMILFGAGGLAMAFRRFRQKKA